MGRVAARGGWFLVNLEVWLFRDNLSRTIWGMGAGVPNTSEQAGLNYAQLCATRTVYE